MKIRSHHIWALSFLLMGMCFSCGRSTDELAAGLVKVGILHSRTGTMSISENTVAEAELMAIDEINRAGGLRINGQRLKVIPIEEDGMSDPKIFAHRAKILLDRERVAAIFGGWTSASRKQMLPVFESRKQLLFYPVQYEGQECSPAVIYGGSVPNQQSEPALDWLIKNRGGKLLLVGSDYVYPRTANRIIRAQAKARDVEVVDELYVPLGSRDMEAVVARIRSELPDGGLVINTLNGSSNLAFFRLLAASGIDQKHGYTVMSFSLSEEEVAAIGPELMTGTMAAWSYFQSLATPASRQFVDHFRARYGMHRVVNDPAESAYVLVYLWAAAAEKAGSVDPVKVRSALIGSTFTTPQGRVSVAVNQHLAKRALIGEVAADGQFRIVEDRGLIAPIPWNRYIPDSSGHRCDWSSSRSAGS